MRLLNNIYHKQKNYKSIYSFLSLSSTLSNTSEFHCLVFSLFLSVIFVSLTYPISIALNDSVDDCHIRDTGESLSLR